MAVVAMVAARANPPVRQHGAAQTHALKKRPKRRPTVMNDKRGTSYPRCPLLLWAICLSRHCSFQMALNPRPQGETTLLDKRGRLAYFRKVPYRLSVRPNPHRKQPSAQKQSLPKPNQHSANQAV